MNPEGLITAVSQLGPALGSVCVIGFIAYKLLGLFDKHMDALNTVNLNMQAHTAQLQVNTQALEQMEKNIAANTETTKRFAELLHEYIIHRG